MQRAGDKKVFGSSENASEAAVVDGLDTIPVETLTETVGILTGSIPSVPYKIKLSEVFRNPPGYDADFADVKGQEHVKRALTVAVAGNHHVIMVGPPGAGKTMLAQRIPTIMPLLTLEEALGTTKIYSILGLLGPKQSLVSARPFRAPHHTISTAGLIGGGSFRGPARLGLSHNGVLFLDELPNLTERHWKCFGSRWKQAA